MRIDLDAQVLSEDGTEVGRVERAIVNLETRQVTEFIAVTRGLLGRRVMVPRKQVESAASDGSWVRLRLAAAEVEIMPDYAPRSGALPGQLSDPAVTPTPEEAGYLWPADYDYPGAGSTPDAYGLQPADETGIARGALVLDLRAEELGIVKQVVVDERTGELEGLLVRAGGPFATLLGGGETLEIRGEDVVRVHGPRVFLRATREELQQEANQPGSPPGHAA